jgi:hypothetical protein
LSLPLAAGLPPLIRKICRFAPYAPCGRSSRKPVIKGSKGEEQPTAVAVGWKEEKNANVHVCIFFTSGGVLPPHLYGATNGRTHPTLIVV